MDTELILTAQDCPRIALLELDEHMIPDLSKLCMSFLVTPFDNVITEIECMTLNALRYFDVPLQDISTHVSIKQSRAVYWYACIIGACRVKSEVNVYKAMNYLEEYLDVFGYDAELTVHDYEVRTDGTWCIPEISITLFPMDEIEE